MEPDPDNAGAGKRLKFNVTPAFLERPAVFAAAWFLIGRKTIKRILIVAGGDFGLGPPPPPFDYMIAADGGAALCRQAGLWPDLIVGDLDSLPPDFFPPTSLTDALTGEGTSSDPWPRPRFLVHPDAVNKDETDLELALMAAARLVKNGTWAGGGKAGGEKSGIDLSAEMNGVEVVLWGIWGGRPDHTLANILILTHPALAHIPASLYMSGWWLRLARSGEKVCLDAPIGSLVSLLPLSRRVTGLFTAGLFYPLPTPNRAGQISTSGGTLRRGHGLGISNLLVSPPASIQIGRGQLLIAYGPPEQAPQNKK